jgi:hypothetical protein
MLKVSQNKKIAVSAIALFAVSFSTMIFFLGGDLKIGSVGGANVMGAGSHGSTTETPEAEGKTPENKMGFSTDLSGNITVLGEEFCELLNQNCEDIIKQPIYKYVNKSDFSELSKVLGELSHTTKSIDSIGPIKVSADEGEEKIIILSAKSEVGSDGKVSGINFSVKDITDKMDGSAKQAKPVEKVTPAETATPEKKELPAKKWIEEIIQRLKT